MGIISKLFNAFMTGFKNGAPKPHSAMDDISKYLTITKVDPAEGLSFDLGISVNLAAKVEDGRPVIEMEITKSVLVPENKASAEYVAAADDGQLKTIVSSILLGTLKYVSDTTESVKKLNSDEILSAAPSPADKLLN